MMDFIKTCGIGLLYLLLSPVILAVFAIFIILTTLSFVLTFLKAVFLFFKGKSIFDKIPEELEAEKIIEARKDVVSIQQFQPNPYATQQIPYQNLMQPQPLQQGYPQQQQGYPQQNPLIDPNTNNPGGKHND